MLKRLFTLILFSLILLSGVALGTYITKQRYAEVLRQNYINNKLGYTAALVESMYVDTVNMDSLSDKVLPALLKELDPHSSYIPKRDLSNVNEALDGEFDGIGIVFNMATDTVIVLNVITSGPSDKAGVRNGDRIIMINDTIASGVKMPQDKVVKRLRGERGSLVKLSLEREGISDLVEVTVKRDKIPLKSMDAAFMLTPEIGFLKLSAFSRNSYSEITSAIADLRKQGMSKLIFDLRGNTGGYLDQAIAIANEFLPIGSLIVYTQDRHGNKQKEFSDAKGKSKDIKLAILIDESSASSSEILAGAIQDNDRGIIIGRRSFGKGLVQQQIPYGDGSALRLTIARYYTPTGRSIQKPYDKGFDAYEKDILDRFEHQEFFTADSIQFADSLKFITPKGKVVYGGGGIMPDIFIPLDTVSVKSFFTQVSGRNVLYRYTIKYTDDHRKSINSIKTLAQLDAFFDDDQKLYNDFIDYSIKQGIKSTAKQRKDSKELITTQLRAYIGRNTPLQEVAFYHEFKSIDNPLQRAIKELESK